ncbi:type IVB secretion system protein IcmH/DotU [Pseudomonas sp.]|uniref:type IVB secretion system protein IcmH/DotU n=1 Tax=Pseudomonas sp. TaxID=306 RepID=UPI000C8E9896|nr:hypothetical protein [Pseudomonadales bacterium]
MHAMASRDDDRTVILAQDDAWSADSPLTDYDPALRPPPLAQRLSLPPGNSSLLIDAHGPNTLLALAAPLLSELVQLKSADAQERPELLRESLRAGIQYFDLQCQDHGIEQTSRHAARYVLCTVLDEAILATRWGNDSDWSQHSLLALFHQETFGGEKFFVLLERLHRDPGRHLDVLELMYVCIALGFQGRYRLQPRGETALAELSERLYRELRRYREAPDTRLAEPNAVDAADHSLRRPFPAWLLLCATLAGMTLLHTAFSSTLEQQRHKTLQQYSTQEARQ